MNQHMLFGRPIFYGWIILACAILTLGLVYGVWFSFTVFFLAVMKEFNWNRESTSMAFSIFIMLFGLAGPLVGMLIQRFGIRKVMSVGALFLGASLASCSIVREPWQYYLTFSVLTALGVAATGTLPAYTLVSNWFVRRRGLVIGILSAVGIGAVGMGLIQPVNGYLLSTIGWRGTYIVLGATMAILIPILCLPLRDRPQDMGLMPDGDPAPFTPSQIQLKEQPQTDQANHPDGPTVSGALRTWRFWGLWLTMVLMSITVQGFLQHANPAVVDLGYSSTFATWIVSLIGWLSAVMKTGGGFSFDRIGRELTITVASFCLVCGLILMSILPGRQDLTLLYVTIFFMAIGYSVQTIMAPTLAADLFSGKNYAVVFGLVAIGSSLGGAIGPWFDGRVFDYTGSYSIAFQTCAVLVIIACALVWLIAPRRARQEQVVVITREPGQMGGSDRQTAN